MEEISVDRVVIYDKPGNGLTRKSQGANCEIREEFSGSGTWRDSGESARGK